MGDRHSCDPLAVYYNPSLHLSRVSDHNVLSSSFSLHSLSDLMYCEIELSHSLF